MLPTLPRSFVPQADSEAVRKLRLALGTDNAAITVRVAPDPEAKERDCYVNVRTKIEREGGRMQLGWAIWQLGSLFIEGEPHAVFDPGDGGRWIDCTPHRPPCREILFVPNDSASYDFDTTDMPDNIRVALTDHPSVLEALKLFSERVALLNTAKGFDLPADVSRKATELQLRAESLLSQALWPQPPTFTEGWRKVGRNDPCPCGGGKKYKKCHGS